MTTITVRDQVGANCITMDDGQVIYIMLHDHLLAGEDVELDFGGVEVISSPFFNAAVGQLLGDMSEGNLRRLLHFVALPEAAEHVLERVIRNAVQHYNQPAATRSAIDDILSGGSDD